jgi:putative RNA 2'-phosphotransferase
MDNERLVRISKYLSHHLRHHPERLGLTVAPGGWVDVDILLAACRGHHFCLTLAELEEVVRRNDKQRFSFDETGQKIRANQGHSITVDLHLETALPPPILYHGTGEGKVQSILQKGLLKMKRHHVHLSKDIETAKRVGARHGKPAVFAISTITMIEAGYQFYLSTNGVWLVNDVPPQFLIRKSRHHRALR